MKASLKDVPQGKRTTMMRDTQKKERRAGGKFTLNHSIISHSSFIVIMKLERSPGSCMKDTHDKSCTLLTYWWKG